MATERPEDRRRTPLEQHVISVLVMLIAAGVLWIGNSIVDLKTQVAALGDKYALRVELQELRADVQRLKDLADKRGP